MTIGRALPALALVAIGLIALGVGQLSGPARRLPLYDGVVVEDPYRYVTPAPGQAGTPGTGESVVQVAGSGSPALVVATDENPPQAQLIAPQNAFAVPAGATSLTGTLTPLAPSSAQTQAGAVGNVYRISVTDQNGQLVPLASGLQATVILRAPSTNVQVVVALWAGAAFDAQPTTTGNQADLLKSQATALGDFALVPGQSSSAGPGLVFLAGALLLFGAVIAGLFLFRRRAATPAARTRPTAHPARAAPIPNKTRRRGRR